MSWQEWGDRAGRPIPVEGGLVARSERGAIGSSWWSRRFVAVLESFRIGGRLTRGKAYARKGQVRSLTVAPGVVSATVQGSRPQPYQVSIGLRALDAAAWEAVEAALGRQALYRAQLLAGEMPSDLEEVFASAGAALFPERVGDLVMRCSCPDPAVPCKHIAATFYLLAEHFDDDPFAILLWRGRSREALLADLGDGPDGNDADGNGADGGNGGHRAGRADPAGAASALGDLPAVDVAASLDRFWLPPVPLPARPRTLDAGPDLVLRQLPDPPPALGGRALAGVLRELYLSLPGPDPGADGDGDPEPGPDAGSDVRSDAGSDADDRTSALANQTHATKRAWKGKRIQSSASDPPGET